MKVTRWSKVMATAEDDGIEILSCHMIETEEEGADTSTPTLKAVANGNVPDGDPVSKQRKRVARAVGVVTFILLLFSVILIGVSLNMSKNIDDMGKGVSCHSYATVLIFP
jgi:hypothetical protein